jgi:hypothetical protein
MSAQDLSLTRIEPSTRGGVVHYLKMAPLKSGAAEHAQINLYLEITNAGSSDLVIIGIELSVSSPTAASTHFGVNLAVAKGATAGWVQPSDFVVSPLPTSHLTIKLICQGNDGTQTLSQQLLAHESPTPDDAYRFWGELRDLRPGEFWTTHGYLHGQTEQQFFAYDVCVSTDGTWGSGRLLPGTDGTMNEHYRIWGKPIYAIADGTVSDFCNDFPTNQVPTQIDPAVLAYDFKGKTFHGNGNFFTIKDTSGQETVLYAHMQPGTLNPALLQVGNQVKKGDFLGLAGNAGAASEPHLHIHAGRTPATGASWLGFGRPMPFFHVRALSAPNFQQNGSPSNWSDLQKRGIPPDNCCLWPSDIPVRDLHDVPIKHLAISESGAVWVVLQDNTIRTTNDRLPMRGIFFDIDPGGQAKGIAIQHEKPYLIGMDDHIFEGLPNGWFRMDGSPTSKRICTDPTTGALWIVSTAGRIYHYALRSQSWVEHPGDGRAKDICISSGVAHVIGLDDRVWKSAGANGWSQLPGTQTASRIAADPQSGKLWIVEPSEQKILSGSGNGDWSEHGGGGKAKEIAIYNHVPLVSSLGDHLWMGVENWGWFRMNTVR